MISRVTSYSRCRDELEPQSFGSEALSAPPVIPCPAHAGKYQLAVAHGVDD
jgi:hypothetical protein